MSRLLLLLLFLLLLLQISRVYMNRKITRYVSRSMGAGERELTGRDCHYGTTVHAVYLQGHSQALIQSLHDWLFMAQSGKVS
jgi:hypothetical protein